MSEGNQNLTELVANGQLDAIKSLLETPEKPQQQDLDRAAADAASADKTQILDLLLSHGAEIGRFVTWYVRRNKSLATFQVLLDHGWDINHRDADGSPSLGLVTKDIDLVKWHLNHGADPNLPSLARIGRQTGDTPLSCAAVHPNIEILQILLDHGASIEDNRPIFSAIGQRGEGGNRVLTFLIDAGMDINAPSRIRSTPLHYTVYRGDIDKTRILLERGADLTITSEAGNTPAEMAKQFASRKEEGIYKKRMEDIYDLLHNWTTDSA